MIVKACRICGKEAPHRSDWRGDCLTCRKYRQRTGQERPSYLQGSGRFGARKLGLEATESPSIKDIYWAAGIYEGEGSCSGSRRGSNSTSVAVAQKDTWILERLKALFGGTIGSTNPGMSAWQIHGARARGFLFTIYSLLSPRRKVQVRKALDV